MRASGTLIANKYRLTRLIGQGGMGEVYEAEHLDVDRLVALKFLSDDLNRRDDARARFEREARAAGRIDHDNVCDVLDIGVDDLGTPFYAMTLLRGSTLADVLRREGPLTVDRAVDVAVQVLNALEKAHAKGVIHRDLKPDNIFLTVIGDRQDFVKIVDFGITKFGVGLESVDDEDSLTDSGALLGTPYYMSPEQARGLKDLDGRVDLYALGVILYRMLTNERPIDGESVNEILWNIWNQPVSPPIAHRSSLPRALDDVILKALARDRDERHLTAHQMRQALQHAVGAESSDAGLEETLPTIDAAEAVRPPKTKIAPRPAAPASGSSTLAAREREVTPSVDRGSRRALPALIAIAALLVLVGAVVASSFLAGEGSATDPHRAALSSGVDADPASDQVQRGFADAGAKMVVLATDDADLDEAASGDVELGGDARATLTGDAGHEVDAAISPRSSRQPTLRSRTGRPSQRTRRDSTVPNPVRSFGDLP